MDTRPALTEATMKRQFTVVIEQDEDGYYIGIVPELPGCHTQAKSLEELKKRIKEAIELYLEVASAAAY
jgi:predicted RNase H-like HicB family nuclease